jgi:hypothetical protein
MSTLRLRVSAVIIDFNRGGAETLRYGELLMHQIETASNFKKNRI